jgi:hypothetical protein
MGIGVSIVPEIMLQPKDKERLFYRNLSESEKRLGYSRYGILLMKDKYVVPGAQEFIRLLSPELAQSLNDSVFFHK